MYVQYVLTHARTYIRTYVSLVDAVPPPTHQVWQGHLGGHLVKVKVPAHEADHKEGAEEEGALGGQLRALLVARVEQAYSLKEHWTEQGSKWVRAVHT